MLLLSCQALVPALESRFAAVTKGDRFHWRHGTPDNYLRYFSSLVSRSFDSPDMKKYKDRILPFIVETLEDRSSPISREDALQSLGQLVSSTGCVHSY